MKRFLSRYFLSWWIPAASHVCVLATWAVSALASSPKLWPVSLGLFIGLLLTFLGLVGAAAWNLFKRRWRVGIINSALVLACGYTTLLTLGFVAMATLFGPAEDGFADNLKIPEGIEIAEPASAETKPVPSSTAIAVDEWQTMVRKALESPGSTDPTITPSIPSLREAATNHASAFRDYIESSPEWHVFLERGNRFAVKRWIFGGEPRDTLHGYISDFFGDVSFQTRCLLCLDRKPWSRYAVQHVDEGGAPLKPTMSRGNDLDESRVMIECGGVWVELFEQSAQSERRVTKATIAALEKEFATFLRNPQDAVSQAKAHSRDLASRLAGNDGQPFRLVKGFQPGIYGVEYSLNPGEPGLVYLKAFEVTQGTPLSVDRVMSSSATRMAWSSIPTDRFGAKSGFTIYEGDWGKPYAARFEVWFRPDAGAPERKLAERIFRIEGWQR